MKNYYSVTETEKILGISRNRISYIIRSGCTQTQFEGQGRKILLSMQDLALIMVVSSCIDMGLLIAQITKFINRYSQIPFHKWETIYTKINSDGMLIPIPNYSSDKRQHAFKCDIRFNLEILKVILLEKLKQYNQMEETIIEQKMVLHPSFLQPLS